MEYLSLKITGFPEIPVPSGVPKTQTLSDIIQWAIQVAFVLAILLSLGFLIYGGLLWLTSEGDKQKLQTARQSVMYAVIGLLLVFLSVLIVNVILYFFQIRTQNFSS